MKLKKDKTLYILICKRIGTLNTEGQKRAWGRVLQTSVGIPEVGRWCVCGGWVVLVSKPKGWEGMVEGDQGSHPIRPWVSRWGYKLYYVKVQIYANVERIRSWYPMYPSASFSNYQLMPCCSSITPRFCPHTHTCTWHFICEVFWSVFVGQIPFWGRQEKHRRRVNRRVKKQNLFWKDDYFLMWETDCRSLCYKPGDEVRRLPESLGEMVTV